VADVAERRSACSSRRPLVDPSVVGRCRSCGRRLYGRGKVCRSRRCPEYGPVWAGDQRQKLFRNLEVLRGDILLSAVTAPGAGHRLACTNKCPGAEWIRPGPAQEVNSYAGSD
jgi:hypothetical protein